MLFSWWIIKTQISRSEAPAILPRPQKLERHPGRFVLKPDTRILADAACQATGEYLAERLRKSTGYPLPLSIASSQESVEGSLVLTTNGAKASLGPEGYELNIAPDSVLIRAPSPAGLYWGSQTLLQLLPPDILAPQPTPRKDWGITCTRIEDYPRFAWRGLLLDVSRHFFDKSEIKKLLDTLALHKVNTFHWHLTDDQGWRIEIKKYPRLTEVGAWRKSIGFNLDPKSSTAYGADGRYGGFYTQDDIREIVAYAQARHITIVPEIEMPGHATAALAAYPEFSCTGEPYSTNMRENTSDGVYCAGNEETFVFLENVLKEVTDLFPGNYIHVGGDEVSKQNWRKCQRCQERKRTEGLKTEHDLQSYFIQRIEKFLSARGRRLIGWSEIHQGGLAANAAVMDWIGGGLEAARAGHDVVMTPNTFCYFDLYQSRNRSVEPPALGGYLPLNKVYSFEPIPAELEPKFHHHILGTQGNVWTEYIPSLRHVEYMAFPRLCALAEVAWSSKEDRDGEDFAQRLRVHLRRLDQLGVNYRKEDLGL